MSTNVFINGMGQSHKGSSGVSTVGPDVCLTRVGKPIVPVPYTNTARSADLAGGTVSVKFQGHPGAIDGCCYAKSTGDEPGRCKGVGSGTVEDKAEFATCSFDVKIEGKGAGRHGDLMTHNNKNILG